MHLKQTHIRPNAWTNKSIFLWPARLVLTSGVFLGACILRLLTRHQTKALNVLANSTLSSSCTTSAIEEPPFCLFVCCCCCCCCCCCIFSFFIVDNTNVGTQTQSGNATQFKDRKAPGSRSGDAENHAHRVSSFPLARGCRTRGPTRHL